MSSNSISLKSSWATACSAEQAVEAFESSVTPFTQNRDLALEVILAWHQLRSESLKVCGSRDSDFLRNPLLKGWVEVRSVMVLHYLARLNPVLKVNNFTIEYSYLAKHFAVACVGFKAYRTIECSCIVGRFVKYIASDFCQLKITDEPISIDEIVNILDKRFITRADYELNHPLVVLADGFKTKKRSSEYHRSDIGISYKKSLIGAPIKTGRDLTVFVHEDRINSDHINQLMLKMIPTQSLGSFPLRSTYDGERTIEYVKGIPLAIDVGMWGGRINPGYASFPRFIAHIIALNNIGLYPCIGLDTIRCYLPHTEVSVFFGSDMQTSKVLNADKANGHYMPGVYIFVLSSGEIIAMQQFSSTWRNIINIKPRANGALKFLHSIGKAIKNVEFAKWFVGLDSYRNTGYLLVLVVTQNEFDIRKKRAQGCLYYVLSEKKWYIVDGFLKFSTELQINPEYKTQIDKFIARYNSTLTVKYADLNTGFEGASSPTSFIPRLFLDDTNDTQDLTKIPKPVHVERRYSTDTQHALLVTMLKNVIKYPTLSQYGGKWPDKTDTGIDVSNRVVSYFIEQYVNPKYHEDCKLLFGNCIEFTQRAILNHRGFHRAFIDLHLKCQLPLDNTSVSIDLMRQLLPLGSVFSMFKMTYIMCINRIRIVFPDRIIDEINLSAPISLADVVTIRASSGNFNRSLLDTIYKEAVAKYKEVAGKHVVSYADNLLREHYQEPPTFDEIYESIQNSKLPKNKIHEALSKYLSNMPADAICEIIRCYELLDSLHNNDEIDIGILEPIVTQEMIRPHIYATMANYTIYDVMCSLDNNYNISRDMLASIAPLITFFENTKTTTCLIQDILDLMRFNECGIVLPAFFRNDASEKLITSYKFITTSDLRYVCVPDVAVTTDSRLKILAGNEHLQRFRLEPKVVKLLFIQTHEDSPRDNEVQIICFRPADGSPYVEIVYSAENISTIKMGNLEGITLQEHNGTVYTKIALSSLGFDGETDDELICERILHMCNNYSKNRLPGLPQCKYFKIDAGEAPVRIVIKDPVNSSKLRHLTWINQEDLQDLFAI